MEPGRRPVEALVDRVRIGMTLAGILFDKDGTFVDFDKTWGTATYEVMRILSRGEQAAFERISAAMHYDVDARRFRATSPLIAGAPDSYVHLWAGAVDRPDHRGRELQPRDLRPGCRPSPRRRL